MSSIASAHIFPFSPTGTSGSTQILNPITSGAWGWAEVGAGTCQRLRRNTTYGEINYAENVRWGSFKLHITIWRASA